MSDLNEEKATTATGRHHAQALVEFVWASPSPFHAACVAVGVPC